MKHFPYNVEDIMAVMRSRGYKIFADEYDLNIVGIRTADQQSNEFNDWLTVFHQRPLGYWAFYAFQATTDPGVYYREKPINVAGTAILKPGQHNSMWKLGQHRGRYPALVQNQPVPVFRDKDSDAVLDFDVPVNTGLYGINLHRANEQQASQRVDRWSAGCQVLADPRDFEFLMDLAYGQFDRHGWDTFTYTLLTQQQMEV